MPDFALVALTASQVGTWQRDPVTGLVRCDEIMDRIFGFPPVTARQGVSLDRIRKVIASGDKVMFDRKQRAISERGGLVVVEYRMHPEPGSTRWVLARGRYEPARVPGRFASGSGIVIDVTESKYDGRTEDKAFFLTSPYDDDPPTLLLDRAADLALELNREAERLGARAPGLQHVAKLALHVILRAT